MSTGRDDVDAAVAGLRARWGGAAPGVVGALALLWNGAGAYTIMMAQAGKLADISAEEAAYYAAQAIHKPVTTWPDWLVLNLPVCW